ncbi:MAG: LacI family DNA-binding transcriptional regulator [Xanthomonadales bacterium]|nr:LacI family transcriptional regulator [Gammaproteobacteria bacterium]NNJ79680.1 LacI family DNA-binding transcriptional regulator [Xanthomonadales bacterium]NNL04338.1 LacI family DNA-binding transcriptional regulator [Xanthomonadales bacterium]
MVTADKTPTINDVAKAAGVSKRTVSRVINHSTKVNAQTRERVEEAIRRLNFAPNRQARGLASRRSYLVGLVYDLPTLFIADIQKGILNGLYGSGYELIVHTRHPDDDKVVDDVLQFVSRTKTDGLLLAPPVSEIAELAEALNDIGCFYLQFSSQLSAEPWKQVVTNYLPAITDMTAHLVDHGHRHFGFISGPRDNISSQKRQEAFIQALKQYGLKLPQSLIVEGAFTYDSGMKAAENLLSRPDRPTAIFAGNDEMAFGVMNVADSMGIDIPRDLSVVGFDGTAFANFVIPSLSTIRRQPNAMAQLGASKLIARINEGQDAARAFETMVSPEFVPRESTGPASLERR